MDICNCCKRLTDPNRLTYTGQCIECFARSERIRFWRKFFLTLWDLQDRCIVYPPHRGQPGP